VGGEETLKALERNSAVKELVQFDTVTSGEVLFYSVNQSQPPISETSYLLQRSKSITNKGTLLPKLRLSKLQSSLTRVLSSALEVFLSPTSVGCGTDDYYLKLRGFSGSVALNDFELRESSYSVSRITRLRIYLESSPYDLERDEPTPDRLLLRHPSASNNGQDIKPAFHRLTFSVLALRIPNHPH